MFLKLTATLQCRYFNSKFVDEETSRERLGNLTMALRVATQAVLAPEVAAESLSLGQENNENWGCKEDGKSWA